MYCIHLSTHARAQFTQVRKHGFKAKFRYIASIIFLFFIAKDKLQSYKHPWPYFCVYIAIDTNYMIERWL